MTLFVPLREEKSLVSVKEKCDKCNGRGYDYVVFDKRTVLGKKVL